MSFLVINSDSSLLKAWHRLNDERVAHDFFRIEVIHGDTRSLPQNNFTHDWYKQIAGELPEDDTLGWRCYCKLHHGVPLLRAENTGFREVYDRAIKPMDYETKLVTMRMWPVTSVMTKKQLSEYARMVQADFYERGVLLVVKEKS